MKIVSTYNIRLVGLGVSVEPTLSLYRAAVMFFIDVIDDNWVEFFKECTSSKDAVNMTESLTVPSHNNINTKYNFPRIFGHFPCYLRRAAIADAFGLVKSYRSNLENWYNKPKDKRGKRPQRPVAGFSCPFMYRGNMYQLTGDYTAQIKLYVNGNWKWVDVRFRKTDTDYIYKRCQDRKHLSPQLQKRGKVVELAFPFEERVKFEKKKAKDEIVVAVDLGINNACTCVVMNGEGRILARRFLNLGKEYAEMYRILEHIKNVQRAGFKKMPTLWSRVNGMNRHISEKTAAFITDLAIKFSADVVVMESLQVRGKKRGSKKQRLHLWRAKYVQGLVEHKCHRLAIHISHVCAANTSKIAFDGSGEVKRGNQSEKTGGNYSLCEFTSGKVYNCDLNAAYNIGARYLIRKYLGEMTERLRSVVEAKVPSLQKRSTCTLSSLYDLRAAMGGVYHPCSERIMSDETWESDVPQGQPAIGNGSLSAFRKHATLVV